MTSELDLPVPDSAPYFAPLVSTKPTERACREFSPTGAPSSWRASARSPAKGCSVPATERSSVPCQRLSNSRSWVRASETHAPEQYLSVLLDRANVVTLGGQCLDHIERVLGLRSALQIVALACPKYGSDRTLGRV
jgi:hypothetical protein